MLADLTFQIKKHGTEDNGLIFDNKGRTVHKKKNKVLI